MARVSTGGNHRLSADMAGGLDVIFSGIQAFEIRVREVIGWRKTATAIGLAVMLLMCVGAWTREARGELSPAQVNECIALTTLAGLYGLWAVRPMGVIWRFDQRRQLITRRHRFWGLSTSWHADHVKGLTLERACDALGRHSVKVCLLDSQGKAIAEIGRWDEARVDRMQVETVLGEIRKVMWWR